MSEMLEKILSNENVEKAYKRVYANKGAGGVDGVTTKELANWGDHYQFVATKSVLAQAISKEKLTKRGLVSLFDYYQKVAHI